MKKKEKMVSITFTVPEKLFGRMEQLRAKEKKSRSIFCRELMGAMVGAVEEWDKKEKKGQIFVEDVLVVQFPAKE